MSPRKERRSNRRASALTVRGQVMADAQRVLDIVAEHHRKLAQRRGKAAA